MSTPRARRCFPLNVGELLEDYTRAMSENELINSLLDVPDKGAKSGRRHGVGVADRVGARRLVAVRTACPSALTVWSNRSAMVNQRP